MSNYCRNQYGDQLYCRQVLLVGLTFLFLLTCNAVVEKDEGPKSHRRILFEASMQSQSRKRKTDRTKFLFPDMPKQKIDDNLALIRNMFKHAYDSYMYNAYPQSELRPIKCKGARFELVRIPALTLIDSLDTLVILGNFTEFSRAAERLRLLNDDSNGLFAIDQNVSLFETNIRVLGGLLSAHQLAEAYLPAHKIPLTDIYDSQGNVKIGYENYAQNLSTEKTCSSLHNSESLSCSKDYDDIDAESMDNVQCTESADGKDTNQKNKTIENMDSLGQFYEYDGILLDLALDIGTRLLPAFNTATGIPYGTVNLLYGVPPTETKISNLASAGSLSLEMELLSRLSGDKRFGRTAVLSLRALSLVRNPKLNLYGKHVNVENGFWTEKNSGIGSNADSFYEYLIKHYVLFPEMDADLWNIFIQAYDGIFRHNRVGDWYRTVELRHNSVTDLPANYILESLMGFFPGIQILLGELIPAARTLNSMFLVREHLGFLPENFNLQTWEVEEKNVHFLRPELLESCYFMHRATRGPTKTTTSWQWAADFALHKLESTARVKCGYACIKHLSPFTTGEMTQTFEEIPHTMKYRLLVDEMPSYFLSETIKYLYLTFDENNILHRDLERKWVFTTEAHPIHHVPLPVNKNRDAKKRKNTATESDLKSKDTKDTKENYTNDKNVPGQEAKIKNEVINLLRQRKQKTQQTNRLQQRKEIVSSVTNSFIKILINFEHHKQLWANKTTAEKFILDMNGSQLDMIELKKKRVLASSSLKNKLSSSSFYKLYTSSLSADKQFYESIRVVDHDMNPISQEFLSMTNVASLAFRLRGKGDGVNLSKTCPNFHHTKWQWMQIIDGLDLEYMDKFIPTAKDEHPTNQFTNDQYWLFTAVASTALYGTDYMQSYLTPEEKESDVLKFCDLNDIQNFDAEPKQTSRSTENRYDENKFPIFSKTNHMSDDQSKYFPTIAGTQRYDMGIGHFDISIFNDSIGFFVQHAQTGEQLLANIFEAPYPTTTGEVSMIMAELMIPSAKKNEKFRTSQHQFYEMTARQSPFHSMRSYFHEETFSETVYSIKQNQERTVAISDFNSNSYFCEIILKEVLTSKNKFEKSFMTSDSKEIGYFPCSAATFGPTFLPLLSKSNGVEIEAELISYDQDDPHSCKRDKNTFMEKQSADKISTEDEKNTCDLCEHSSVEKPVQLVQRGICAFDEKACIAHKKNNAGAVIVINSEGNKLFVMSSSGVHEKCGVVDHDLPISVLVTKENGSKMLEIVNNSSLEENQTIIKAVVRIRPQVELAKYSTIKKERKWPHILATKNEFQILAQNGWGIHVTRKGSGALNPENWQLLILEHHIK